MITYESIYQILQTEPLFLLVTATGVETDILLEKMVALNGFEEIISLPMRNQTYYLGRLGEYNVIHVQCGAMGSIGRDSSINTVTEAITCWNPDAIIMLGIAFGKDKSSQRIGDVLVSQSIVNYESVRLSRNAVEPRFHNVESGKILFNRFQNIRSWEYPLEEGRNSKKILGAILSGEKLVDNEDMKEDLFSLYPSAVGGEMESYGMYSAAASKNISEWIMVKGICDWANGEKEIGKEENQLIAAKSAVSLCKEVFSRKVLDDIPKNPNRIIQHEVSIGGKKSTTIEEENPLSVKIKRCAVRCLRSPDYSLQINMIMNAKGKVYIRKMQLEHKGLFKDIVIPINYLYFSDDKDYLELGYDDYIGTIKAMKRIPITSIEIGEGEYRYYSVYAMETGERLPDGYEDFHLHNWNLRIIYNDNEENLCLNFKIHKHSSRMCVKYRYTDFGGYDEGKDVE